MIAFLPTGIADDDYSHIRADGMWYQEWQGGYHDILKMGYPRPKHKTTILAELHSPHVPDFMHGGAADVPFLVSSRAKKVIRDNQLTGIRFSRVEIAKIATKGKRRRNTKSGEPEDQILKATDQAANTIIPTLHAAYTIGRLEVIPQYNTGRCPHTGYVSPYELPETDQMPDLWRPTIDGRTFSAWIYCSERFVAVVNAANLSNIAFTTFRSHMDDFKSDIERRITTGT